MALSRRHPDLTALAADVRAGHRLAIARAMSLAEQQAPAGRALLAALYPHTGQAHIIGVTGAPGTGKSTLVTALAQQFRGRGLTVGIVAIDPTSPFTGGALLGDRVRMRALSGDDGVFIRSAATRGSLGGLSTTTGDLVTILDAAGFARIIVETVGVGQAEVEIASAAHTTLVVEAPGLGDEVQAIKAGLLEIADILVVNKADRPGADRTVQALNLMLESDPRHARPAALRSHHPAVPAPDDAAGWFTPIRQTTALTGQGVTELVEQVDAHRIYLQSSGGWQERERLRAAHTLTAIVRAELERCLAAALPPSVLAPFVEAVQARTSDPYTAARTLLSQSNLCRADSLS